MCVCVYTVQSSGLTDREKNGCPAVAAAVVVQCCNLGCVCGGIHPGDTFCAQFIIIIPPTCFHAYKLITIMQRGGGVDGEEIKF